MTDVFISYSRQNQAFVRQLFGALEIAGQDAWVDWEDIPLTTDWWKEIREGIEGADTFVFVMTPESLASPVCTLEVDHALRLNKRLVPVLPTPFDHTEALKRLAAKTPDSVITSMSGGRAITQIAQANWDALAAINWVQFSGKAFTEVAQHLLTVLETDYEHVNIHTRLLQRALEWQRAGRPSSMVLRDDPLRAAEAWLQFNAKKIPLPTTIHRQYIAAGVWQRSEDINRLRLTIGVLLVLLVLSIGAGAFAVNRSQLAESAAATAQANLRAQWDTQAVFLADQSLQILQNRVDSQAGLLVALEGLAHYDDGVYRTEAQQALTRALSTSLQAERAFSHGLDLYDVDITADKTRVVVSDRAGGVRVWDIASGAELAYLQSSPTGYQANFSFYPGGDPPDPNGRPLRVRWSPDGGHIFLGEPFSGMVWTWETDALTRLTVPESVSPRLDVFQDAAWSPDGSRILYRSNAAQAVVWAWQTAPDAPALFQLPNIDSGIGLTGGVWSADGGLVGFTSVRGIYIWPPDGTPWRLNGGWLLWHPTQPHTALTWHTNQLLTLWQLDAEAQTATTYLQFGSTGFPAARAAFRADGRRVVSLDVQRGALNEWDSETGERTGEISLSLGDVSENTFYQLGYTGDGTAVRLLVSDGRGWVWTPADNTIFFYEADDDLRALDLSPDGQMVMVNVPQGLRFYPFGTSSATAPAYQLYVPVVDSHTAVWLDARRFAVWGMSDNQRVDVWRLGKRYQPRTVAMTELRAERLSSCGADGVLVFNEERVYHVRLNNAQVFTLGMPNDLTPLAGMSCDAAGRYAATWDYDGLPTVWDVTTQTAFDLPYPADLPAELTPQSAVFSPDGTRLAVALTNYTQDWLVIIPLDNPQAAQIYPDVYALGELLWRPDGGAIAVISGNVTRVNLNDGVIRTESIGTYLSDGGWASDGKTLYVYESVSTPPNMALYAMPDGDGTVKQIWNYTSTEQVLTTALSADGRWFAAALDNSRVLVWDVSSGETVPRMFFAPFGVGRMVFHTSGRLLMLGTVAYTLDLNTTHLSILDVYIDPALAVWSADGTQVITFERGDTTVIQGFKLWTVDVPTLIAIGQAAVVRTLTDDERAQYFLPPRTSP